MRKRRQHQQAQVSPPPVPQINLFVLNAEELLDKSRRNELLKRMELFALEGEETTANPEQGCWLLIMIHSSTEGLLASSFAQTLRATSWSLGTLIVEERSREKTAQAIIELHALHFPSIPTKERPKHILLLGGAQEQRLYQHVMKKKASQMQTTIGTNKVIASPNTSLTISHPR